MNSQDFNAYIQFPDGHEIELDILEPDPADGSLTLFLPEGCPSTVLNSDSWIRIVPVTA